MVASNHLATTLDGIKAYLSGLDGG
jgi:hypothetical protein